MAGGGSYLIFDPAGTKYVYVCKKKGVFVKGLSYKPTPPALSSTEITPTWLRRLLFPRPQHGQATAATSKATLTRPLQAKRPETKNKRKQGHPPGALKIAARHQFETTTAWQEINNRKSD